MWLATRGFSPAPAGGQPRRITFTDVNWSVKANKISALQKHILRLRHIVMRDTGDSPGEDAICQIGHLLRIFSDGFSQVRIT